MLSSRFLCASVLFCLLAVLGCATSVEPGGEGGSAGDAPTAGGPSDGGAGGGDGGGTTSPCAIDCSTVTTGACLKAVCNDGMYAGPIGDCVVVPDDGASCDDGVFCTTNDVCEAGICVGGPPNDCGLSPGPCEDVVCNEGAQSCSLQAANNGDPCQPDDLCEIGGTCSNGLCIGMPNDCFFSPVPNECHDAVCNPTNGLCEPVPANDGIACVDSNDLCSVGNTCSAGVCSGGTPKDCSALDVDCDVGVCDAGTGQCITMTVPQGGTCYGGVPSCHEGTCDANGNCVPSPLPNGSACDDYDSCTTGDTCTNGTCDGSPVSMCTTYFETSFENGCGGWTLGGEWECGLPTSGPSSATTGTMVLGTDLDADYDNDHSYETNYAQTPPISLASAIAPQLIYQHYVDTEGFTYDGYNVKISTDGGNTFSVLNGVVPAYDLTVASQPAYGGHINAWQTVTADLVPYVGQTIILRFSFRTDLSVVYPGVYIDDVTVTEGPVNPLAITTTSLPNGFAGDPYIANVQKGGGSANSVWSITGGTNIAWLSINPTTGALSGAPTLAELGPVSVDIHVEESNDPTNFADATFNFEVLNAVWSETFEGTCPNGWTLGGDWQCGVPTSGPGGAFSGTQCIATQLGGNYNNNQSYSTATASSPAINLASTVAPYLSFRVWYETEGGFDGFNLKVSNNGGASYTLLTLTNPTYNQNLGGEQCWAGTSGGWVEYQADLSAYAGQSIHLRFALHTDGSVLYPGVYIDDVTVID